MPRSIVCFVQMNVSVQFAPRMPFLNSARNRLLLFCLNSFWLGCNETSPPTVRCIITFPVYTYVNLNLKEKRRSLAFHEHSQSTLHGAVREVKNSTDGENENFTITHSLTFFSFFFFLPWQHAFHFPTATVTSVALLPTSKKENVIIIQ